VGLAGPRSGAVGGTNGRLVVSDTLDTIPDVVAPTGAIGGPDTAVAGAAVASTAQVADEAGGSGIDPTSFLWTSAGLPSQRGHRPRSRSRGPGRSRCG